VSCKLLQAACDGFCGVDKTAGAYADAVKGLAMVTVGGETDVLCAQHIHLGDTWAESTCQVAELFG